MLASEASDRTNKISRDTLKRFETGDAADADHFAGVSRIDCRKNARIQAAGPVDPHVKHFVPGRVVHFRRRLTEVRGGDPVCDQDVGCPRLRFPTVPNICDHFGEGVTI
jgi:hypothetical protein